MDNGRGAGIEQRERLPGPYERLLELLADRRESLLDALVEGAFASRRQAGGAEAEQLRASMGEVFDTFVACATVRRDLHPAELALFERIGAARCSDGVAPEPVLEEFRAAFDRCYARLIDLVGQPPDTERVAALKELTPTVYWLRDAAIEAIGRGHAARQQQTAAGSARGAVRLLRALLDDETRRLTLECSRLGLAADRPATLVVAIGSTVAHQGRRLARLLEAVPGALAVQLQPHPSSHVVMLATVDGPRLPSLVRLCRTVGGQSTVFALPRAPLAEVVESYWWLVPRLWLGGVLADEHGHLGRAQLNRYRLLADVSDAEAHRYVAETIGPLLAQPAAETARWRVTLAALCHTEGVVGAADQLGCDRATVGRHAAHIADLTGLDPRAPDGRRDLAVALVLLDTHPHILPPVGDERWLRQALE